MSITSPVARLYQPTIVYVLAGAEHPVSTSPIVTRARTLVGRVAAIRRHIVAPPVALCGGKAVRVEWVEIGAGRRSVTL